MNSLIKISSLSNSLIFLFFNSNDELYKEFDFIEDCQQINKRLTDFYLLNPSMNHNMREDLKSLTIEEQKLSSRIENELNFLLSDVESVEGSKSDLKQIKSHNKILLSEFQLFCLLKESVQNELATDKSIFESIRLGKYQFRNTFSLNYCSFVLKSFIDKINQSKNEAFLNLTNLIKYETKNDQIENLILKFRNFIFSKAQVYKKFQISVEKINQSIDRKYSNLKNLRQIIKDFDFAVTAFLSELKKINIEQSSLESLNRLLENYLIENHSVLFNTINHYNNLNFLQKKANDQNEEDLCIQEKISHYLNTQNLKFLSLKKINKIHEILISGCKSSFMRVLELRKQRENEIYKIFENKMNDELDQLIQQRIKCYEDFCEALEISKFPYKKRDISNSDSLRVTTLLNKQLQSNFLSFPEFYERRFKNSEISLSIKQLETRLQSEKDQIVSDFIK